MKNIPKGLISRPRDTRDYLRGVNSPIKFIVRNSERSWEKWLTTKQPQKYAGYETNDCWCLAGINNIETQCNFLKAMGQFPQSSLDWFQQNGYFDSYGNFDFSERFIAILSGVRDNGNDHIELWRLARTYGLLPRADLAYTDEKAAELGHYGFLVDYFNPDAITVAMRMKAADCLKHIDIAYEWLGKEYATPSPTDIKAALLQSPLQIGIPVCIEGYNNENIPYCASNQLAHSVMLYNLRDDGIREIRDQYNPYNKTLPANYWISMVLHGVVSPILNAPYVKPTSAVEYPKNIWTRIWENVYQFFRN